MADFDAILFFMLLGIAFVFMFATHPDRNRVYAIRFISVILFFASAMILASDVDIVFKSVIDTPDSTTDTIDKKIIIENNQLFLSWILVALGVVNLIMTGISIMKHGTAHAKGKSDYEDTEWPTQ